MEIEQDGDVVPSEILRDSRGEYFGRWESDLSGPREFPDLGPRKQVKSLVTRFQDTARQYDDEEPWSWHNETGAGDGCGSHAHITFADQTEGDRERFVEGMTIAWNSAVELTPFLAPFFCSDWENGFRGSINRWASPQLTRYSQSTMDRKVRENNQRTYDSVTLSPREGAKPITIELRLNEAHPSFALVGLTFLRRTMTKAMREGWSPKLAGDRRSVVESTVIVESSKQIGEEVAVRAQLLGEFGLEVLLGGRVVGVNAVAVLLAFEANRVGGSREGERDGPRHRRDVHPHVVVVVEFGGDAAVRLLEGGVVVVHVIDSDPLSFGIE